MHKQPRANSRNPFDFRVIILEKWPKSLIFQEISQNRVQNTTIAIVIHFHRCINAAERVENDFRAICLDGFDGDGLSWFDVVGEVDGGEGFWAI